VKDGNTTDNDSTASSPAVKRKAGKRKLPVPSAVEKKNKRASTSGCKLKNMQPSFSAADEKGNDEFDDFELSEFYQEIVCKPEEDNDSDFYMNYHPASTAGSEGPRRAFPIPEVSIDYLFLIELIITYSVM
jgi:hypothetical protein